MTSNPESDDTNETVILKLRANGTPDTAWGGGDGQVNGTFAQDVVKKLAVAPGGKLVAATNTGVARFNADGSPDNSFAGDGRKTVNAGRFVDMAVGADGRVYLLGQTTIAGTFDSRFTVRRLKADGNADSTWDGDGVAHVNFFNDQDDPSAIALRGDGKVVLAGTSLVTGGLGFFEDESVYFRSVALARLTASGAPDTSFSSDGKANLDVADIARSGNAVAFYSGNLVVVGGSELRPSNSAPSGVTQDFFLTRLKADGSTDTTFGSGGRVVTDFGGQYDTIFELLSLPDGKTLALGQTGAGRGGAIDLALARYNHDGTLDTTFSGDGKMTLDLGGLDVGVRMHRRSDGDIILSAKSGGAAGSFALVRINPNGSLDTTLGGTGIFYNNLSTAFLLQDDGKILLGGWQPTAEYPEGGLFLTRLHSDGSTDTTYGTGGRTPVVGFTSNRGTSPIDLMFQGGDGDVVALASVYIDSVPGDAGLFRFTAEGEIDETFGAGQYAGQGKALYPFAGYTVALALDPVDRILVLTTPRVNPPETVESYGVLRVLPDGAPDAGFGDGGVARGTFHAGVGDIGRMPDGRPVVVVTDRWPTSYLGYRPNGIVVARLQHGDTIPQNPFRGTPYRVAASGPVTIEAEDYDRGGEGVAFHDLTPATNSGGAYRTGEGDGVDVKPTADAGGGYRLSDAMAGEWLEDTLAVIDPGDYDLSVRVGSAAAGGVLHLEVDGVDVSGPVAVPNTGGYDRMVTLTVPRVHLASTAQVLRLVLDANSPTGAVGGVNWLRIAPASAVAQPVTLRPAADAYVRDGSSSGTNFGTATELVAKRATVAGSTRESYLRFDLSGGPATIASGKLRLFGRLGDTSSASLATQVFSSSNTTWSEAGLNWDNRPGTGASALGTITVSGTSAAWYELDLTAFLAAEKAAGRNLVTLVLRNPTASSAQTIFASDEAASGQPELVVS